MHEVVVALGAVLRHSGASDVKVLGKVQNTCSLQLSVMHIIIFYYQIMQVCLR